MILASRTPLGLRNPSSSSVTSTVPVAPAPSDPTPAAPPALPRAAASATRLGWGAETPTFSDD